MPQLPPGIDEAYFLELVDRIAPMLAKQFSFGCHDIEDVASIVQLEAWKAATSGKYDPARGSIDAFLYSHCKKRLMNLRRDELWRTGDEPCRACREGRNCQPDGTHCKAYAAYYARNLARRALAQPVAMDSVADAQERRMKVQAGVEEALEAGELSALIDSHLPIELRRHYLLMRDGKHVPRSLRTEVQREVRAILEEHGYAVAVGEDEVED